MKLVILNYGVGNIKSIQFAFDRLGVTAVLSSDAEEIKAADKIIFPGVGEASSAMKKLREVGLEDVITKLNQPVLGICLGMQLMCSKLEEGNTNGLGIFDVAVKRFSTSVKVPHMGWNTITNLKSSCLKIFLIKSICIWCIVIMLKKMKILLQQQTMSFLMHLRYKKIIFMAFSFTQKKVENWEKESYKTF